MFFRSKKVKEKKIPQYIIERIEISSDSDREDPDEETSNEKNPDEENYNKILSNKQRKLSKKARERYQNLSEEEKNKEKRSINMVVNDIKNFWRTKNKAKVSR